MELPLQLSSLYTGNRWSPNNWETLSSSLAPQFKIQNMDTHSSHSSQLSYPQIDYHIIVYALQLHIILEIIPSLFSPKCHKTMLWSQSYQWFHPLHPPGGFGGWDQIGIFHHRWQRDHQVGLDDTNYEKWLFRTEKMNITIQSNSPNHEKKTFSTTKYVLIHSRQIVIQ